jgi:Na+/proline symporter
MNMWHHHPGVRTGDQLTTGERAAALPQPSSGHVPAATLGFLALAVGPAASQLPWRRATREAAVVLVAMLAWLAAELQGGGNLLGLSERVVAGAEALCPFAVALAVLISRRGPTPVAGSAIGESPNPGTG